MRQTQFTRGDDPHANHCSDVVGRLVGDNGDAGLRPSGRCKKQQRRSEGKNPDECSGREARHFSVSFESYCGSPPPEVTFTRRVTELIVLPFASAFQVIVCHSCPFAAWTTTAVSTGHTSCAAT